MEETSYRIMKTNEFDAQSSTFFRAACACSNPRCDLTLTLEYDEDLPDMIDLLLYKDLYWASYWADPDTWHNRVKARLRGTLRMLFTGRVKIQETFIFQGEEHIQGFINALADQLSKMKDPPKAEKEG